ncbi:hypothetical protein [Cellulomonas phragmiteti]|uniref:Fibronectin type-III domain-containing protein n=1 Tax=Cellulomonas phragmiteti TaxID=478780 RepID=A0ABQ4DP61_9CELL|nr:hypothetical protein [Cellulomonas phragmiteti]GIG41133.1 hypothetical protein Cph01nite_28950 [Cellulomonas phragmiteti]
MDVVTDPVLELATAVLAVDPGGEARTRVTVHHTGDVVAQYRVEVLGDAARWSTVTPHLVSVLPGEEQGVTVEVVFRPPPPPAAPVGDVPFGVRCVSLEHRDVAAVVEGDLVVSPVQGLDARLRPDGPGGARAGRFRVELQNVGTTPLDVDLQVTDAAGLLRFALAPRRATVPAGGTVVGLLAVTGRAPRLLGPPVPHPFTVTYAEAASLHGGELAGTWEQRAAVRTWWLVVGALLVLGLVLGWLWLRGQGGSVDLEPGLPPPVVLTAVEPGQRQVRLVWERSAYATGYVVRERSESGEGTGVQPVDAQDQTSFTWPEREPGTHCYDVAAVAAGLTGPASPQRCVEVSEVTATPTATPEPEATSAAGGPAWEPVGWYVVYNAFPLADTASATAPQELLAQLQSAGATGVRMEDSRGSVAVADGPGDSGMVVVLKDGFASEADARAECDAFRAVAGFCIARPPAAPAPAATP